MLDSINETEGLTYYTFRQIVSDVIVQGASVKLIVDADGTAICAVASLKSGLDIQLPEKPELTTEDVERIVDKTVGSSGYSIVKGLTHQAVVEINRTNRLVWVVYTDNPREDQDVGFFAFYVNDQGELLDYAPIVKPYSTDEGDPHRFHHPEFVWDQYYFPAVEGYGSGHDYGGVHINSALLNRIAWRLHEAGMTPEDEFDYMMNVILTMTGGITYPDLAVLLPWCLEQVKMDQYMDTLMQAIEETGIEKTLPQRIPESCALIMADIPGDPACIRGNLLMSFLCLDEAGEVMSVDIWPDARLNAIVKALLAGGYAVHLRETVSGRVWVLRDEGWLEITGLTEEEMPEPRIYFFEAGETYGLPSDGLTQANGTGWKLF